MNFRRLPTPPRLLDALRNEGSLSVETFMTDTLFIIVSEDQTSKGILKHVSFSNKNRLPTWDEVKEIRENFFSQDTDVMMVLPKSVDYVNINKYTFHLWETPSEWGIR